VSKRNFLAFVHIEKAAGTTFTSILQRNFLYRHCNVKTMKKEDNRVFSADSMSMVFRINPFVRSIAGHSVTPFSDLERVIPHVKYITLMREPIDRYVSHYQHQVERMGSSWTFEDFLEQDFTFNFQTMKIAGAPDIDKAKQILRKNFFLVGIVEEFANFLSVLQQKLLPENFDIRYEPKNVATRNAVKRGVFQSMTKYRREIEERNAFDLELYDFVKNHLFKNEKANFNGSIQIDLKQKTRMSTKLSKLEFNIYRIYRKIYYEQLVRLIRLANGLPGKGSY